MQQPSATARQAAQPASTSGHATGIGPAPYGIAKPHAAIAPAMDACATLASAAPSPVTPTELVRAPANANANATPEQPIASGHDTPGAISAQAIATAAPSAPRSQSMEPLPSPRAVAKSHRRANSSPHAATGTESTTMPTHQPAPSAPSATAIAIADTATSAADANGAREMRPGCGTQRGAAANGSQTEANTIHVSTAPSPDVPHHAEKSEAAATTHNAAPKPNAKSAASDTARPAPVRRESGSDCGATERSDIGHNIELEKDLRTPTRTARPHPPPTDERSGLPQKLVAMRDSHPGRRRLRPQQNGKAHSVVQLGGEVCARSAKPSWIAAYDKQRINQPTTLPPPPPRQATPSNSRSVAITAPGSLHSSSRCRTSARASMRAISASVLMCVSFLCRG